jgi:hypothetical protein
MKKFIGSLFLMISFLAISNHASATHVWVGGSLSGGTRCLNTGLCMVVDIDDGCDCIVHVGNWYGAFVDPNSTMEGLIGEYVTVTWYNPDGSVYNSQSGTVANTTVTDNGDGSWTYDITWQ